MLERLAIFVHVLSFRRVEGRPTSNRIQTLRDEAAASAYDRLRKTKAGTSVAAAPPPLSVASIAQKLPRELLTLTLSDGKQEVTAIELDALSDFSLATPVGTKVAIRNAKIKRGILHLKPANIRIISSPPHPTNPEEFLKYLVKLFEATLDQRNATNHLYPDDNLPPSPSFVSNNNNNNYAAFNDDFALDDNDGGGGGARGRGGGARGRGKGSRGGKGSCGGVAGASTAAPKAPRASKASTRGARAGARGKRGGGNYNGRNSPPPADMIFDFDAASVFPGASNNAINNMGHDDEEMEAALLQWEIQTNAQGQEIRPRNSVRLPHHHHQDEFDLEDDDEEMLEALPLDDIYENAMQGMRSVGSGGNGIGNAGIHRDQRGEYDGNNLDGNDGNEFSTPPVPQNRFNSSCTNNTNTFQDSNNANRVTQQIPLPIKMESIPPIKMEPTAALMIKAEPVPVVPSIYKTMPVLDPSISSFTTPTFLCNVPHGFQGKLLVQGIFHEVRIDVPSRRLVVAIEDGTMILRCILNDKLGPGWDDFRALSQWKQTLMLHEYRIQIDYSVDPPCILALTS
ncbi:UNVERIFIED_CONTAM: hypothetical protein HDU68_001125 [Siphonaria sp. JEL0065]|nr:hypothetical protein HDU68_001125 [Siphonaria sp. JEL0065]